MTSYHSLADDYYVSMNLSTEMELTGSREAILHYFEQMQKKFPEIAELLRPRKRRFRSRGRQGARQLPLVLGRSPSAFAPAT